MKCRSLYRQGYIRILLAVLLLASVFFFVDPSELIAALRNVEFIYVVYLLLIAVGVVWLSSLKWQVFVRASGHDAPLLTLMKYYTVGYFFNIFTPSYVGGDVARSYHLGLDLENQKDAFMTTFLERFTGLLAMSVLGAIFVLLGAEATAGVELAIWIVFALSLAMACVCFFEPVSKLFFSLSDSILERFTFLPYSKKIRALLNKVNEGMHFARNNTVLFVKAMLLSFAFHVLTVVNTWVAALAVGWDPNFGGLFVVVPLILLVSMIPLTPNGWGIQEGAFLYFLQRIGGTQAQGLGVGLVLRAKVMLVALFGGVLWLWIKKRDPKRVATEASQ